MQKIIEFEKEQKNKFIKNKHKLIDKISIEYLSKHSFFPLMTVNREYIRVEDVFQKFAIDYFAKFKNGTLLDALWAFDEDFQSNIDTFSKNQFDCLMSNFYLRNSQMRICFFEGRIEQYLKFYFENICLLIAAQIYGTALILVKSHAANDLNKALKNVCDVNFSDNHWLSSQIYLDNKNMEIILKYTGLTFEDLFNEYKFCGYLPNSAITSEKINLRINDYLRSLQRS